MALMTATYLQQMRAGDGQREETNNFRQGRRAKIAGSYPAEYRDTFASRGFGGRHRAGHIIVRWFGYFQTGSGLQPIFGRISSSRQASHSSFSLRHRISRKPLS